MSIEKELRSFGILQRLNQIGSLIESSTQENGNPLQVSLDRVLGPTRAVINGTETILLGTNNYLGLNHDPDCIEAAIEGVRRYGTGSTASRVASGTLEPHLKLEAAIADLYGWRHAALFSTAFMANLGIIAGLTKPDDLILIDSHCHASIFDGCYSSGATVQTFRHGNAADLDRQLTETTTPPSRTLIVVESLYSVLGDEAPLHDIIAVKEKHGALLLVDEAHALGLFGERGAGLAEARGVLDGIDFISGTFSKSAGLIGGFGVSNRPEFRHLYLVARPYLFTASLPPAIAQAAVVAIGKLGADRDHRARVWENARYFHGELKALGFDLAADAAPIICIRVPSFRQAYEIWGSLLSKGVYVNCLIPPATPNGWKVLRCSVSAAHSREELGRAVEVFEQAGVETGLLSANRTVPGN